MQRPRTRTIVAAAAALAVVAGGGAAVAATRSDSPQAESNAVVADAAKQLGVDPGKLDRALRTALANRVDRAVAAGTMTKEQGDALKKRVESAGTPLFGGLRGGFRRGRVGPAGDTSAAADYLGMTRAQLFEALRSGKTLADLAKEKGKSVDGLVDAIVAATTKRLDEAVAAGRLTDAQRKALSASLKERVTSFVNGEFRRGFRPRFGPALRPGGAFRFRFREGAPPRPRDSGFRVFS